MLGPAGYINKEIGHLRPHRNLSGRAMGDLQAEPARGGSQKERQLSEGRDLGPARQLARQLLLGDSWRVGRQDKLGTLHDALVA